MLDFGFGRGPRTQVRILRRSGLVALLAVTLWTSFISGSLVSPASAESYGFLQKWGSKGISDGQFQSPGGVAVDASGNVYVADTGNNRIQKFSSAGTWLVSWGGRGTGPGLFSAPDGVAVDGAGNVYVADTSNNRIQKFTSDGQFITGWGTRGAGTGQFSSPRGVAVDGAGNVYIADTGNSRIQKFSANGDFLATWGTRGSGDGQLSSPEAIAVDSGGNIYIADTGNSRVEKLDSGGAFVTTWGSPGTPPEQFSSPRGIAVDGAGNVYVADSLNNRTQKFTSAGTFRATWGGLGTRDGEFFNLEGVAVDSAGSVYVADTGNNRIQVFSITRDPGPTLTAPADGGALPGFSVTLSWVNAPGTTQYQIQVVPANNDGPGANVVRNVETNFTLPSPPLWYGLLPGMSYTWRVRTSTVSGTPAEGDWTAWSARSFRTPVVTSESISLVSPIQESKVGTLVPTLRWSNSNAAIFYYEVQVSEDPAFNTDPAAASAMVYWELRHGGITNPTNSYAIPQSFPLKAGTTYYWRVRPRVQGDGVPVEWSPIWIFRTQ